MIISQKGIDLIKRFEGFSTTPYEDTAGQNTVGYGHLIKQGEVFDKVTMEQAEGILRQDIAHAEQAINAFVNVQLNQNEFDALISLAYNIGMEAFRSSTLLRLLNSNSRNAAARQFTKWIYAGGKASNGLRNRREQEAQLFLTPPPPPTQGEA